MRIPTTCVLLGAVLIGLASAGVAIANEAEVRDPTQPVDSHSFTALNQTFTEDFDDYRGSAGTLPDSLFVSWDDRISEPFQGVNTGAFTAYSSDDSDHSFGIRERAPVDLRDGRLFFAFTNDTGEPVTEIRVSYDVEAWFIGDRRNRVRLKYDTLLESAERDTFETDIVSTDNPSSETTPDTDVDGSLPEHRSSIDVVIHLDELDDGTGTMFGPLAPGATAYLRWQVSNADDDSGSLRSGLAINNLSVTFPGPVDENGDQPFSFVTLGQVLSEGFDDYRGTAETLPEHFSVSWDESRTSEPFQGVNSGGFTAYTFDNVDHAFGIREREPVDLRDARLLLAFSNDTGSDITHIEVSYDVEAWFIGDRRNRVRLKYDTLLASAERDTFETDIASTDNPSSTTTPGSEVDGTLAENREAVTVIIDLTTLDDGTGSPFGPLAHSETAFLRWQVSNADGDGGDLRSGLAIDNVVVMPIDPAAADPDPTDPTDPGNGGEDPVMPQAPAFSPAPGDFDEPVTVTLSSTSEGATIFFTLDGSEPTTASASVANGGTVTIDATATLSAIAAIGDTTSAATIGEFTITIVEGPAVAAPELSPPGGTFVESVTVALTSATEGALIRFTTDGSDPTGSSDSIENGGELTLTATTELRAIADLDGEVSDVVSGSYAIAEGIADDILANGNFASLNARPTEALYPALGGPPGWRLVVEGSDGGRVGTGEAASGSAWFAFNTLGSGFGENKLEQCVPIDATRRMDIAYQVRADTPDENAADIRVRINPNFYANLADCLEAMATESGGERLDGGRSNDDMDFDLGAGGNEWISRGPAEQPGLRYEVADLPAGTTWMRLSVRARDRSGIAPAPRVRLDDIRVTQDNSSGNMLLNGSFEQVELRDRDFLSGADGWFVDFDGDAERRAGAGPVDFALFGSNAFFFEALTENFSSNRLDQCVPLDGETLQPALFVRTASPSADLSVRINVDFFPEADCGGDRDGDLRLREDFDLDVVADAWINLVTEESRAASDYGGAQSALLSIRMRDRSSPAAAAGSPADLPLLASSLSAAEMTDGGGGALGRLAFLDGVSIVSGVAAPDPTDPTDPLDPVEPENGGDDPVAPVAPNFSPAAGEFSEPVMVTLTSPSEGATIFFTLDGSEPTTASASVANGGTVTIDATATLSAIAAIGDTTSAATIGEFTITIVEGPAVAAPELSPPGGTFVESVTVALTSATEGALIRFTTDGSDPTGSSDSIENGGELTLTATTELRAIADLDGEVSDVTTGSYEIQAGISDDILANGGFGSLNPRPAEVTYPALGGPPGWRLVVEGSDGGRVGTGEAASGSAWFAFNTLGSGFGENKLEQCVPIDADRRVDISYRVRADTPDDDASDLRVRINPNFYANLADCLDAMATDSGGERLSGGRSNDDMDFDLGARGNEWILRSPVEDPGLRYEVADLPEGTTWMRLSVRNRSRSAIDPAPRMRMDDIRVTQGTSTRNLLLNGGFEQIELRDRDFLSGADGWFVDFDGDADGRAGAGPVDFALVGNNVFFFEALTGNFGSNRLDQCVPLDGETLQPALFVRTASPSADLSVRINVDFFPEADCGGDSDGDLRLRQDFDLDVVADAWINLVTEESRAASDYGGAQSALLSIRMRDRSGVLAASSSGGMPRLASSVNAAAHGNGGGALGRLVFLDAVSIVSGAAAPDPDPDPQPDPEPPPVAPPDPQPAPGPLRSSGCSVSGQPGPLDPTLWLLALAAAFGLFRRRRPCPA